MEVLKSVGIVTAFKGFLIFLLYGFITTAIIAGLYGLEADLPKSVLATLEEPISIYTFGWLSVVGLVLLAIVTKFGKRECDFNINRPKMIFWVALPICEAAVALGIVIGGTLLGVAICSHILMAASLTSTKLYPQFYALAAFMFLITYPVAYFTIALIDTKKTVFLWLNISALVYASFIAATFYFTLPVRCLYSRFASCNFNFGVCVIFVFSASHNKSSKWNVEKRLPFLRCYKPSNIVFN